MSSDSDDDGVPAPPPPRRTTYPPAASQEYSDEDSESDAASPPPKPPARSSTSSGGGAATGDPELRELERLSSRLALKTPTSAEEESSAGSGRAPHSLAEAVDADEDPQRTGQGGSGRDARLSLIITNMKAKLETLWPQGIDPKTKLRWINSDATVASKASEVLSLPSSSSVIKGEADRFNGDSVGAKEYIVLKARIKQRESLMASFQKQTLGLASLDGEKKVICEGSLTKMALSGKNSWKKRHFKLTYAPAPRYAGPYLQYFEEESSPKEKGRVVFQAGDMLETQSAAPRSSFGFSILAKDHSIKLRGFAETEEDLMRWVRAFNACINSFTVAAAATKATAKKKKAAAAGGGSKR